MISNKSHFAATEILHLIEEAKAAELCRDTKSLRKILLPVWDVSDCSPTFEEYAPAISAELLRLAGFFLTFHGRARNLKDYHLHSKDLLTRAISIFDSAELFDKSAESKIILAFCYWNSGEVSESEALLDLVENDFGENKLHPVYLQIKINRLLIYAWSGKYDSAIKSINELSSPMRFCHDMRLKAMFHSEAGIIHRRKKIFANAEFHFREALRLANQSGNHRFIALNFNNLAMLHKDKKEYERAREFADKAIKIYSDLGDQGWIPHVLDTKALIFIDEEKFVEAEQMISEALTFFFEGEDYDGLTNALWTKCRCLLRLGRIEESLVLFGELMSLAGSKIGESATLKFAKNLMEEIYVLQHLPLPEEVAELKKTLVSKALIKTKGVVGEAATILKLKKHQNLSDILQNQFPTLRAELGFRERAPRRPKEAKSRIVTLTPDKIHYEKEYSISRLILNDKQFSFDFHFAADSVETFYFDKFLMIQVGIESGAVVAVIPVGEFRVGKPVLIALDDGGFLFGKIEYDDWASLYFICDRTGMPIPLDGARVIGEPVAFCPVSEASGQFVEFSRFEFLPGT